MKPRNFLRTGYLHTNSIYSRGARPCAPTNRASKINLRQSFQTLTPDPPEASQSLQADFLVTRLEFLLENALQEIQGHSQHRACLSKSLSTIAVNVLMGFSSVVLTLLSVNLKTSSVSSIPKGKRSHTRRANTPVQPWQITSRSNLYIGYNWLR